MHADVNLGSPSPMEAGHLGRTAEEMGFDGIWISEKNHSPFTAMTTIASNTSTIDIGTAIAVAFPRSPMITAYSAWDLQAASDGRFILGLGTQVKGHIERRFSESWEAPGPRLRDYIRALKAIWESWSTDSEVDYHGEFYTIDLCPPEWRPEQIDADDIPIYVAGVNDFNLQLAGDVCDGLHIHPICSPEYIEHNVIPTVNRGADRSNRSVEDITLVKNVYTISGDAESEREREREAVKRKIAFHASTRTYRPILKFHGWEDISEELHSLSVEGEWNAMANLISDEMVETLAVQAQKEDLFDRIAKRYPHLDRACPIEPFTGEESWRRLLD